MKTAVIIVAGGSGERFGSEIPKQFVELCKRPLLSWAIERFERADLVTDIYIVVPEDYLEYTAQSVVDPFDFAKVRKVISGGSSRQESVYKGLKAVPKSTELVAIHDGARVLISPMDINRVIQAAHKEKAAIIAKKASDTIKRVENDNIIATIDRNMIYQAQTPQVFVFDLIMKLHEETSMTSEIAITDDASLAEQLGITVKIVEPTSVNIKITTPEDLIMVESLLKKEFEK